MSRIKDFEARFHLVKTFQAAGIIGATVGYPRRGETSLQVVVEGVGSNNSIQPQGRLKDQTSWQSVGSAITSTASGTTVDISKYDEFRFNCTVYDGADDVAEVQKVAFSDVPDAGNFKLNYGSDITANIAFSANAAAVQTAVRTLNGLETATVAGDFTSGFDITFPDDQGNAAMLTVSDNTLTKAAVAVTPTVTQTTAGTQGTDDSKLIVSGFFA